MSPEPIRLLRVYAKPAGWRTRCGEKSFAEQRRCYPIRTGAGYDDIRNASLADRNRRRQLMSSQDDGSVTGWIGDLRVGGDSAAQHLWERYFHRLVHLARARFHSTRRTGVIEDEEDVALSAFDSFCRGVALGRYPQLDNREDLWRLLVVITIRKIRRQFGARRRRSAAAVGSAASRIWLWPTRPKSMASIGSPGTSPPPSWPRWSSTSIVG